MSGTSDQGRGAAASTLVVLTPAHNEVEHLEALFDGVLGQERRPDHWVICDDGSNDGTGARARQLAEANDFVTVVEREGTGGRGIGAKAHAVAAAYDVAVTRCPDAAFVVSLDADVELPPDAFRFLLDRFGDDPTLGVAGGIYLQDEGGRSRPGRSRPHHVPGPLQAFRREVFDAIGGYQPLADGGLDVVSTAHARMLGWRTTAFPELVYRHHRRMGTGGGRRPLSAAFHGGVRDRSLGARLPFMLFKTVVRLTDRPLVVSALARLCGFTWGALTRRPSSVPGDVAAFIRAEQRQRLVPTRLRRDRPAARPAM